MNYRNARRFLTLVAACVVSLVAGAYLSYQAASLQDGSPEPVALASLSAPAPESASAVRGVDREPVASIAAPAAAQAVLASAEQTKPTEVSLRPADQDAQLVLAYANADASLDDLRSGAPAEASAPETAPAQNAADPRPDAAKTASAPAVSAPAALAPAASAPAALAPAASAPAVSAPAVLAPLPPAPPLPPIAPASIAAAKSVPLPPRRPASLVAAIAPPAAESPAPAQPAPAAAPQAVVAPQANPPQANPPQATPAQPAPQQAGAAPAAAPPAVAPAPPAAAAPRAPAPSTAAQVPVPAPARVEAKLEAPANSALPSIGDALAAVTASVGGSSGAVAPEAAPIPAPEVTGGFKLGQEVYVRIFKQEGSLELWMKRGDRYALYKTFSVCKWSGALGPKTRQSDYQSPEGFYSVSARQLNPHSHYHLAFDVGYPNAFDRRQGYTGSAVMVHGDCKSVGCFAMTNAGIDEIYPIVAAALAGGQREVPVHIFPFRMTEQAIARESAGPNAFMAFLDSGGAPKRDWSGFWRNLKQGYDLFERSRVPPVAFACGDRYEFGGAGAACARIAGW